MMRLCCLLISLSLSSPAFAKVKRKQPRGRRGPASVEETAEGTPLPRMLSIRGGLLLAQETIAVKGAESRASMETQFQGVSFAGVRSVPFGRSRFARLYLAQVDYGVAKGKANGVDLNDAVKGQMFYAASGALGVSYITSPVSRVAITVPLIYRRIGWKGGGETGFDPDRDASFSVGLSGVFESRFSIRSSMIVTATYQHLWESTTFGLAYQHRLR